MRKILAITSLFILCLYLISCCACRKGSPVIGNLENTQWKLIELCEQNPKSSITLFFDPAAKVINGQCDGCKLFGGYHLYESETENIEFLTPGYKGENCKEIAVLSEILKKITTVKIDSKHLLLIDKEGSIKAIFSE